MLPLYPALCLLVAHVIISSEEGKAGEFDSKLVKTGYVSCQLVIVLLGLGGARPPLAFGTSLRTGRPDPGGCSDCGGGAFHLEIFQAPLRARNCCCNRRNGACPGPFTSMGAAQRRSGCGSAATSPMRRSSAPAKMSCSVPRATMNPAWFSCSGPEPCSPIRAGPPFSSGTTPKLWPLIAASEDDDFKREAMNQGVQVKLAGAFSRV